MIRARDLRVNCVQCGGLTRMIRARNLRGNCAQYGGFLRMIHARNAAVPAASNIDTKTASNSWCYASVGSVLKTSSAITKVHV